MDVTQSSDDATALRPQRRDLIGTELQQSNWPLTLIVGLPALATFVLRWNSDVYQDYLRWLRECGVPITLFTLDGYLLLLGGALFGARLAAGRGQSIRSLGLTRSGLTRSWRRGLAVGAAIGMPSMLLAVFVCDGLSSPGFGVLSLFLVPIAVEAFFRGLLVSIPVRFGGKRFWTMAILAGLLNGTASVPWGSFFSWDCVPDFCVMTVEGVWLAWLVRCYDWNLWVSVGVVAMMSVTWTVFHVPADLGDHVPWYHVGLGLVFVVGTVVAVRHRRRQSLA